MKLFPRGPLGFLNPQKLVSAPSVWKGDDWEIIFAQARTTPFFQLGIAPSGKLNKHIEEAPEWICDPKIISDTSAPDRWTVNMSIKLKQIVPGGVKPANHSMGIYDDTTMKENLCWSNKIAGWWFDGCYFADAMYRSQQSPNFQSFATAAKAGNPDNITPLSTHHQDANTYRFVYAG